MLGMFLKKGKLQSSVQMIVKNKKGDEVLKNKIKYRPDLCCGSSTDMLG